jgi:4-hydroxy-2-oxoheptanedioate aldolase
MEPGAFDRGRCAIETMHDGIEREQPRGDGPSDAAAAAGDDDVCLLLQAESVTALENLERICAVDDVHGIFIGPADLAASMGHRGRPDRPEVQNAIEGAIKTIVATGKAAGTLTGDPKLARRYLELGASFVAVGIDLTLLAQGARRLAEEFGVGTLTSMSTAGASAY